MNKKISWLAGILVFQLALALSLNLYGGAGSADFDSVSLLQFDAKNVDKVVISDGKKSISLEKKNTGWILPGHHHLAVSQGKVQTLLNRVHGLKTNWPVATTSSSHSRFEVADDKYRRKLELYSGDKSLGTLYVGTSPGFKKSHIRKPGEDDVYALALNAYDLPVTSGDWLDKSLLAVKDINRIKGRDYELSKQDAGWRFSDTRAGEKLDRKKAEKLVDALGDVRVMKVAENPPALEGKGLVTMEVQVKGGKTYLYRLLESEGNYYIQRSDIEPVFRLSKTGYESLAKPGHDSLVMIGSDKDSSGDKTVAGGKQK